MISERDIWTSAGLLIKEHGERAPIIAAQRADQILEMGNFDEQRLWRRIMHACAELIDVSDERGHRGI